MTKEIKIRYSNLNRFRFVEIEDPVKITETSRRTFGIIGSRQSKYIITCRCGFKATASEFKNVTPGTAVVTLYNTRIHWKGREYQYDEDIYSAVTRFLDNTRHGCRFLKAYREQVEFVEVSDVPVTCWQCGRKFTTTIREKPKYVKDSVRMAREDGELCPSCAREDDIFEE